MRLDITILTAITTATAHVHASQCRPKQSSPDKTAESVTAVAPIVNEPSSSRSHVPTLSSLATLRPSVASSSVSQPATAEPITQCVTTVGVTTCSTKPTTSYITVPKTCISVITDTITSTFQPVTTITTTALISSTVTDTRSNQVQTTTSTSSVVTTVTLRDVLTTTVTVTSTLQTVSVATPPAAFTPIRSSLPGASTVNQQRKKRGGFFTHLERDTTSDSSVVDPGQLRHGGDVKCHASAGPCTTSKVTSTVTTTEATSTSTITTTSTVLVIKAPSATSTTTVITTDINTTTVTAAPTSMTVAVTTTTTEFTSTTYPACDPTNIANRVNGEAIVFFRQNDTSAVITTNHRQNTPYDCCASSLQVADSALWFWNPQTNDCFHIGIPSCKAPQADNRQMTLVIRPNPWGYTVGNAYCGQWGFAVEA